jgi:GDP-mannose 6-dehydrogenase
MARLVGANREYITKQIPHLSSLLCDDIDEVVAQSDVIVVGNNAPEFGEALKRTRPEQMIVDLVRVRTDRADIPGQYQGICW